MDNIKNDFYYVKRILQSIEIVQRYLANKSIDDLLNDGFLGDAIENRFIKIAEDSSKLTKDFKDAVPIPWSAIATIRNKACHNYDVVDAPTLYKTIKFDFPAFRKMLLESANATNMYLKAKPFKSIENKTKKIEMRLYDEKRKKLIVGNLIVFINKETNQEIIAEIQSLKQFTSFYQLYANYHKSLLGYKEDEYANPDDMLEYYSKEDIERYGVLAIELKIF